MGDVLLGRIHASTTRVSGQALSVACTFHPFDTAGAFLLTSHDIETVATPPPEVRGSSLLTSIREATRASHARIEELPLMQRLMSPDYTGGEYRQHLGCMLGFYEPFEAALMRAGAGVAAPISPSKSRLLAHDLEQLGSTPAQIEALPRCSEGLQVSAAGLLGFLYVYEGASLGAQVIARRLRQSLGASRSFAFYHADASLTAHHWKAFCQHLASREAVSLDAIRTSAVAAFDAFGNWLDK